MPTLNDADTDDGDELPPDLQFESFYDKDSATWTLRRIKSSPPTSAPDDDDVPDDDTPGDPAD